MTDSTGASPHLNAHALDADLMQGFVENFLLDRYADRAAIPPVHREWWSMVTSTHPRVAIAAPRNHAKSTALNHAYGLAASLFKQHPFQIKVSRTYGLAVEKLQQAKEELISNEKIKAVFKLKRLIRDTENDFIAEMSDGYRFRMYALGMQQAVRGLSWGTYRPTLINVDDGEDDEQVANPNSRDKAWKWVMNVLLPMGAANAHYRIYGTILHRESVLAKLLRSEHWLSATYEACDAPVSVESILWPEHMPRDKLLSIKSMYVQANNLVGFNMEYRNIATDEESGFFQKSDFLPMQDSDRRKPHIFYVGGDLAISTDRKQNRTVFVVGGVDPDGWLDIVDVRKGHWDGKQIIDELFDIQRTFNPDAMFIESGQILKSLMASLEPRMRTEGVYPNIVPMLPQKDKMTRAFPIRSRMRTHNVRFETESDWFTEMQENLLAFRGLKGDEDDELDALAWVGQGLARMVAPPTEEESDEDDMDDAYRTQAGPLFGGRSLVTGY